MLQLYSDICMLLTAIYHLISVHSFPSLLSSTLLPSYPPSIPPSFLPSLPSLLPSPMYTFLPPPPPSSPPSLPSDTDHMGLPSHPRVCVFLHRSDSLLHLSLLLLLLLWRQEEQFKGGQKGLCHLCHYHPRALHVS